MSIWLKVVLTAGLAVTFSARQGLGWAQSSSPSDSASDNPPQAADSSSQSSPAPNLDPPRSDRVQARDLGPAQGDSSSKDTEIDLSPPTNDVKEHPNSSSSVSDAEAGITPGGVGEFHTWNPHQAAKELEVGDFYYKRGNYKAAEERYREALKYKDNDAVATFRLAQSLEKLGLTDDACAEYDSYLKILPQGSEAKQAQKALERLKAKGAGSGPQ